jgi:acyl-CoA thioester hydrolase
MPLPTAAQVAELPNPLRCNVTDDRIDANGHMNVLHYLDFGSSGADALVRQIGIDDAYRAQRRLGVFAPEHHLRYYSELLERDETDVDRSASGSRSALGIESFWGIGVLGTLVERCRHHW